MHMKIIARLALAATVCTLLAGCTSVPSHNDAWLSFKYETKGPGCGAYNFPPPGQQSTYNSFGPTVTSAACPGLSDFTEAQNYYTDIGAPATLTQWKATYGFPAIGYPPARGLYGNYRDLRIGRDMDCVQNGQQVACYVSNYGLPPQDCSTDYNDVALCYWPSLEPAVEGAFTAIQTPPPPAQITSFSVACGRGAILTCTTTFQAVNSFSAGLGVQINNLSVSTYPSGQTLTVISTGLSNTQFEAVGPRGPVDGSSSATAATGTATYFNNNLIATVAMVYNGNLNTSTTNPPNNITFYVYDNNGNLLPYAILDDEGEKSVPRMCMGCHGGNYTPHSSTSVATVTGASFLPFDVPSFYYSTLFPSLGMDQQQEAFRMLNLMVKSTNGGSQPQTVNQQAIVDFINGLYCPDPNNGGVLAGCTTPVENSGSTAIDTYIPSGWIGSSANQKVYSEVIKPYCRMCHMAQTFTFTTPDQFTAFAAPLVCTQKDMPHAEVPFGGPADTNPASKNPFLSSNDTSVFWLNTVAQNDVKTATSATSCQ
ncbi:MAG: hypothetical protein ACRD41_00895 [Candidatus Acidiferrales bacterium]